MIVTAKTKSASPLPDFFRYAPFALRSAPSPLRLWFCPSPIDLRGQSVLLDADVAEIYGVETKRINEAVKNNPDKFPAGYIIELDKTE